MLISEIDGHLCGGEPGKCGILLPGTAAAEGVALEEQKFAKMLRESFLSKAENELYVLETEGRWVAALRLTRLDGFYYLEALETKPDRRKKGYGKALLEALCTELAVRGPVVVRDCVAKRNEASLRTHLSAGFVIDQDPGIEYPGGEADVRCFGMLYRADGGKSFGSPEKPAF